MKTTSTNESPKDLGLWARLASALAAAEMTSIDLLELRIAQLEKQVARLNGEGARSAEDES